MDNPLFVVFLAVAIAFFTLCIICVVWRFYSILSKPDTSDHGLESELCDLRNKVQSHEYKIKACEGEIRFYKHLYTLEHVRNICLLKRVNSLNKEVHKDE